MSSTKNNRIKRLIVRNVAAGKRNTIEMPTLRHRRVITLKKGDTQIEIFDNTHGRKDRRLLEIVRLNTAIGKFFPMKNAMAGVGYYETPGKKERMGKFAHKKNVKSQKAEAKQSGGGKKKKGGKG